MNELTVKSRLQKFIWFKQMRVSAFEKACGLGNGYVAAISKGIGIEKQAAIAKAFPELSMPWLLTGEGNMLRSESEKASMQNIAHGDVQTQINNAGGAVGLPERFLDVVEKQQQQIDKLIGIIEKLQRGE